MRNETALFTTEGTEDTEENTEGEIGVEINVITGQIVDSAMKVHSELGPGLLINFNCVHLRNGIRRMAY